MAGTISYAYNPNQEVWVIVNCEGTDHIMVQPATVIRVRGEVLVTKSELEYDVRLLHASGTISLEESDIFVDLPTAVAEYQARLS